MHRIVVLALATMFTGCGGAVESPPPLPSLSSPLPGPPPTPPSVQLPSNVTQSLSLVDAAGHPLLTAHLGATASVEYRTQLPSDWGTQPNQAFSKSRNSFISFEIGFIRQGRFVIGSHSIVEAKREVNGQLIARCDIKLPIREDTEWILRARLAQSAGQPLLTLLETPVELIE